MREKSGLAEQSKGKENKGVEPFGGRENWKLPFLKINLKKKDVLCVFGSRERERKIDALFSGKIGLSGKGIDI